MTGYGQEEDRRRSEEAGFDAHMVKPVDLKVLQELLSRPDLARRDRGVSGRGPPRDSALLGGGETAAGLLAVEGPC